MVIHDTNMAFSKTVVNRNLALYLYFMDTMGF